MTWLYTRYWTLPWCTLQLCSAGQRLAKIPANCCCQFVKNAFLLHILYGLSKIPHVCSPLITALYFWTKSYPRLKGTGLFWIWTESREGDLVVAFTDAVPFPVCLVNTACSWLSAGKKISTQPSPSKCSLWWLINRHFTENVKCVQYSSDGWLWLCSICISCLYCIVFYKFAQGW